MKRILAVIAVFSFLLINAWAQEHKTNLHYEPSGDRITASCIDHKAPKVLVTNGSRPDGVMVTVDCEREK